MKILWENAHMNRLTLGRPIASLMDSHMVAGLQEWAETDQTVGFQVPSPATVLTLKMSATGMTIDVVKSRLPVEPDSVWASVVLTAIAPARIDEDQEKDKPGARFHNRLLAPPYSRQGPNAMAIETLAPDTVSFLMPYRRQTRNSLVYNDDGRRLHLTKQCHLLIDEIDWEETPLGPKADWPVEILATASIAFSSFTQDCVYVGKDLVMIYNQKYSVMVEHPKSFGRPMKEVWAPLWSVLGPIMMHVYGGDPVHRENDLVLHQRNDRGRFIERYQSYSLIPIVHHAKKEVIGIYNPSLDTTEKVLAERRLDTTKDLVEMVSLARTTEAFFEQVAAALEGNPGDAPFVILYSITKEKNISDEYAEATLQLRSTVGVPEGHPVAPKLLRYRLPRSRRASPSGHPTFSDVYGEGGDGRASHSHSTADVTQVPPSQAKGDLSPTALAALGKVLTPPAARASLLRSPPDVSAASVASPVPGPVTGNHVPLGSHIPSPRTGSPVILPSATIPVPAAQPANPTVPWPLEEALSTRQCLVVDNIQPLIQGFPVRQWTELPDLAVVVPISSEGSEEMPSGVMVLGLNLYRPLDPEYEEWVQVIRGHLTLGHASVRAFEEEVSRREERAKLERAKATWFRGSAHELRSPLTLISVPLEELSYTKLASGQSTKLAMARRNVQRLESLVNSLLNFMGLESGQVETSFIPTPLDAFVSDITDVFRPAIKRLKYINFVFEVDASNAVPTVNVDRVLLEMVVSNLLMNALKYTHSGTVKLKLWFDSLYANICVSDTGHGIPASEVESVTDPSHRAETSLQDRGANVTGVGLALVNEIVLLHGGELVVESTTAAESGSNKHGSTLTARLSLDVSPSVGADQSIIRSPFGAFARQCAREIGDWVREDEDENGSDGSKGSGSSGGTSLPGLMFAPDDVLLVVDPTVDMRDLLRSMFSPFCTVLEASNTEEALQVIEATPPHLVLCDNGLQGAGQTTVDLLTAVRTTPSTRFVPFVIVSDDDQSRIEAFIAGADDYLLKPVGSKELVLRVHLHMQMGKKRAKLQQMFEEQLLNVERRRIEAEESREQQEFLVDLISHEIRTPVSAILQCAQLARQNLAALREQLRFCGEGGFHPSPSLLDDLEEDVEALDSIYQCGLVQERIAGDILSLASIQQQMLSFHDVHVDIRQGGRKMVSVFSNEARMKKIDLVVEFGDSLVATGVTAILTDPVRLGQVVTNLISNAIRFTAVSPKRRVTVTFNVSFDPPQEGNYRIPPPSGRLPPTGIDSEPEVYLYVSVSDTGPGITPGEQVVLFQRFHQGNNAIHTRFGGTGLGLFLCKSLTELLGGGIEVDSTIGQGTTFRFAIKTRAVGINLGVSPGSDSGIGSVSGSVGGAPSVLSETSPTLQRETMGSPGLFAPIPSPVSGLVSNNAPLTSPELAILAAPDGGPTLNVLVVEDNEINQRVLKRQLIKCGLTCDVASNGKEALVALFDASRPERFRSSPRPDRSSPRPDHDAPPVFENKPKRAAYDIVLMDLEMPVMDGLTALYHIRDAEKQGTLQSQLVFALTGNAREGQVDRAFAAGMDDVVIKPYRLPDLVHKMREAVAHHRVRQEAGTATTRLKRN
ncbi:hypothetical protein Q8F55_006102 [Vanrija albida]|uniref:Histidine kinase n=1 Tax=Vanrija albida TaxID=181172 RepID=A0ABR3Q3G0_9TREE